MMAAAHEERGGPPKVKSELNAFSQLQEAIFVLPQSQRAAYDEAVQTSPQLVANESSPWQFLRQSGGDPWAAAHKITLYWERRKELFGERAFLPMTQTGNGALNRQDLEVLRTGFVCLLPPDDCGRPVICFDRSRLENDFHDVHAIEMDRLRVAHYIFFLASTHPGAQAHGCRILAFYSGGVRTAGYKESFLKTRLRLIRDVMPVNIAYVDLVVQPPRNGKRSFMETVVPPILNFVVSVLQKHNVKVHTAWGKDRLRDGLLERGLSEQGLPKDSCGGQWRYYSDFALWRRERTILEKTSELDCGVSDGAASAADIVREEQRKRRRRDMDAMYARRKRATRRVEKEGLERQVKDLTLTNKSLVSKNEELTRLMNLAQATVAQHISTMSGNDESLVVRRLVSDESSPMATKAADTLSNACRHIDDLSGIDPDPLPINGNAPLHSMVVSDRPCDTPTSRVGILGSTHVQFQRCSLGESIGDLHLIRVSSVGPNGVPAEQEASGTEDLGSMLSWFWPSTSR